MVELQQGFEEVGSDEAGAAGDEPLARGGAEGGVEGSGQRSEVGGQRSAVGGRRSEIGGQRSEGRGQGSAVRDQKGTGILDHAAQHSANLAAKVDKLTVLLGCDVAAVFGEIEGRIRLAVFAIAVSQFTDKVCFVPAFRPGFSQIQANRTGGTTNLTGQREPLFSRKVLGELKDLHTKGVALLVYFQVLGGIKSHRGLS